MPGFISLRNNYTPGSIVTVGNADLNLELWAVIAGISGFYDEESPFADVHQMCTDYFSSSLLFIELTGLLTIGTILALQLACEG